jgi:hypothetical protein
MRNGVERFGPDIDPERRIEQRPDDQFFLDALAHVGEPIGLFGLEGLAGELVADRVTR